MEFASKYILFSEKDEYETISDEELEHGMRVRYLHFDSFIYLN